METLKQKLSDAFLTQKQAFKFYIEDRNWKIYKKKLVDDIIKCRKRPHCTTFDDVPVVVRNDNAHYFEKYDWNKYSIYFYELKNTNNSNNSITQNLNWLIYTVQWKLP